MSDNPPPPTPNEQLRERFYPTHNEHLHSMRSEQSYPTCGQQFHPPCGQPFQHPAHSQPFQRPARGQQFHPAHGEYATPLLLDHQQLQSVQFTATKILIEAFASGTLSSLNDEVLRHRAEYHLRWHLNALDMAQAHIVVSQT